MEVQNRQEIQELIDRGFLFVINHSGGKDSQAMASMLAKAVPAHQRIAVHAILHEVDWEGIPEHIEQNTDCEVFYVAAAKGLLDMVEQRGKFPSPKYRQCTSDLKRGPLDTFIRRYLALHPEYAGRVVNCMGMRAEESTSRAKLATLKKSERNSKAGRTWYEWLPIHHLTAVEVFRTIAEARQVPHWAYGKGMSRLSCVFCIMANTQDLTTAAKLKPELYARYVALEKKHNYTMSMSQKLLPEITGIEPS